MRFINISVLLFLLTGCASTVTKVPVAIPYPKVTVPPKVVLPISQLNVNHSPGTVMHAYVKSVELLIIDDNDLRERLKAFQ